MKQFTKWSAVLLAVFVVAVSAVAQFQPNMPRIRGVWSPTVGSGAVYQLDSKEGKSEIEYAIVGTENVAGKTAHWMEMVFRGKEGEMVMKTLTVIDASAVQIKRMIMQPPGEDPMEFPMEMMFRGNPPKPEPADIRTDAELVGTETITVPAGTFTCQHYRTRDKSADVWVTENVAPYGLVKTTSKDGTMTLVRVVTNVKSRIRGTPKKFDPMEMMRQRPE